MQTIRRLSLYGYDQPLFDFDDTKTLVSLFLIKLFSVSGMNLTDRKSVVQGKSVSFDRSTINRYYGLANIKDDEYQPLVENDGTNWDKIKKFFCKKDVVWNRYTNGGLKSLSGQEMTKVAKI